MVYVFRDEPDQEFETTLFEHHDHSARASRQLISVDRARVSLPRPFEPRPVNESATFWRRALERPDGEHRPNGDYETN
jgi:hypothetical protein